KSLKNISKMFVISGTRISKIKLRICLKHIPLNHKMQMIRLMKKFDIKFKNWKCNIQFGQYGTGATALSLVDHVDGEPVATASVNLMKEDIDPRIRADVQSSAE